MTLDKAEWHWDSTEELYREKNKVKGNLTQKQADEIWLRAGNHIGLFLRWVIDNHFEGDEAIPEECDKVRSGKMSGAEYLMCDLDGTFWDTDVNKDVHDFVLDYYEKKYFKDYGDTCPVSDKDAPCYSFISGDDDYKAIKEKIDKAYKDFTAKK